MIKGSEAQKQRPDELLWMLRFDEKSTSISSYFYLKLDQKWATEIGESGIRGT